VQVSVAPLHEDQLRRLYILDAPDGESVAKFALVVGAQGNVRTKTVRAYTEAEFDKLLGEISDMLPD
jgi:uncharacterized protein with GYD domain